MQAKAIGRLLAVAGSLLLAVTGPAHAVDGVIEINQARALAGGVTVDDAPGFPVTISQPGSYRLTSNLTVPDADTTAIEITVGSVTTIDLNGFAILGPKVCSGFPVTCTGTGTEIGSGIVGLAGSVTVRDGTIRGMGGKGLRLGPNSLVQGVRAQSNGGGGIGVGGSSMVTRNRANGNRADGINAGTGSTVSTNTANGNSGGITVGNGSLVSDNTANNNLRGIIASAGTTVRSNTARDNVVFGLSVDSGVGWAGNVFTGNNGGDENAQVSGSGIQLGPNVCGTALCP